jgi:hypothetical protein
MANYKITNLTNLAGKRDIKFNSVLDIDYVDNMKKKSIKVKPGETVFLQINSLPTSVHKLRVRKLISVVEVSNTELKNNMNATKPVTAQVNDLLIGTDVDETTVLRPKKKAGKKSSDVETPGNQ